MPPSKGAASRPTFPLPKGHFGDVQLSSAQQDGYRAIAQKQIDAALVDEHDFVRMRQRQVDPALWKLVTRKHQLQVYRRRERINAVGGSVPSMMSVGKIEGTLEDLLYGSYVKTHEEMKITNSYVDVSAKDCTVLSTIDTATPDDPFHYLGIKWLLSKFPVVRPRDWCYLEAMGINHDVQGERYGYLVLHSVDRPECPPFHRKAAIRGQLFFTFILRERSPGTIEVYSRGSFDPAGELIHQFSVLATAGVLTGIVTAVKCAEAKKLTLLALANGSFGASARTDSECSVCSKPSSMRLSLRNCRVCHETVCNKCSFKKHLFSGLRYAVCRIECCATCIVRAKEMKVRPAEREFSILAQTNKVKDPSLDSRIDQESSLSPSEDERVVTPDSTREYMNIEGSLSEEGIEALVAKAMSEHRSKATPPPPPSTGEWAFQEETSSAEWLPAEGPSSSYPDMPRAMRTNSASSEQEALYLRLLELQFAAMEVESTTKANQSLMDGL